MIPAADKQKSKCLTPGGLPGPAGLRIRNMVMKWVQIARIWLNTYTLGRLFTRISNLTSELPQRGGKKAKHCQTSPPAPFPPSLLSARSAPPNMHLPAARKLSARIPLPYIYIYVLYMYIYKIVYTYTYMCIHNTHTYIYICMYVCTYIYIYI